MALVLIIDKMQLSKIKDKTTGGSFYIRSRMSQEQKKLIETLNLVVPKDTASQDAVNQLFKQ
jgi:hypothetical protein